MALDAGGGGEGAPVKYARVNGSVPWSEAVGAAIVARTAAGESLRAICRDPAMPQAPTVARWVREKPEFAAAFEAAREAAGRPFAHCAQSTYCHETALAIFERLCRGEGVVAICRDPDMPVTATVWRWRKLHPEFDEAVAMARDINAERMFETGWAWACAVTPETAQAAKVQLAHLRWSAGKLAPKKFGNLKPAEPPAAAGGGGGPVTNVYMKTWVIDPEGGPSRESERPAELLYSVQAGEGRGAPAVVTRGPGPSEAEAAERADKARARGEAIEAARAAGMTRFNGAIPTRFWPAWYREAHPQAWAEDLAHERYVARTRIRAMASHGLTPTAEDLIQADWTAEAAAERHPVQPGAGGYAAPEPVAPPPPAAHDDEWL